MNLLILIIICVVNFVAFFKHAITFHYHEPKYKSILRFHPTNIDKKSRTRFFILKVMKSIFTFSGVCVDSL